MRIDTQLTQKEYNFLKKESKEVLGLGGALYPPFLQKDGDYIEVCVHDSGGKFLEKSKSENCEIIDDKIVLKPGQDLRDMNYNRGNFLVRYYFYRREGGADEVVLTKTIEGVSGVVYSGDPTITGVPAGLFYIEDGKAYEGEEPTDNPQELNITEYKFFIDEISTSRTEIRVAPQNISNDRYKKQFENLYRNELIYRTKKTNMPDNFYDLPPEIQEQALLENPNLADEGGDIKFDNPQQENESALELSLPNRLPSDTGFRPEMQDGYLVIKDAYTLDSQNIPNAVANEEWEAELPIPEAYIEVINLGDVEERKRVSGEEAQIFPMSGRFIVKETATDKSLRGLGSIFTPTDGTQYHFDFGCGHTETTDVPYANHNYDTEGSYNITVTIMTPSFTSTVTDMYSLDFDNPAPLEGPGQRGPELDSFIPVPMGEVNENGEVVEPTVYRALSSALDGRIIGWDGTGEFQPMVNVGQWERYNAPDHPRVATSTTRWYVQSGYRRYVGGTHFNSSNTQAGIELLRKLKPGSFEQPKILNSNNELVDGEPVDLLVTAEIINDLPVGPPISLETFGGNLGDKPYEMGQPFYRGIPLAAAPDLNVNDGDAYLSPFEQNTFGRHFDDNPDSEYHSRFYTKEFGSGNDDKSQIGLDEVLYEGSGVKIRGVRTHQYKFRFGGNNVGGYIIVAKWDKHFGDEGDAGGYVWAPRLIIDPSNTIDANFVETRIFTSFSSVSYENHGFIVGDRTYNPSNDYDSNTWKGRFLEDLTREVEDDNRYPKLRTDHQQALSETAGKQIRLIFRSFTQTDLLDGYGPTYSLNNIEGYGLSNVNASPTALDMLVYRDQYNVFKDGNPNTGVLIGRVYDLEPREPQTGESPVTFNFSTETVSTSNPSIENIVVEKPQGPFEVQITNFAETEVLAQTNGEGFQILEFEHNQTPSQYFGENRLKLKFVPFENSGVGLTSWGDGNNDDTRILEQEDIFGTDIFTPFFGYSQTSQITLGPGNDAASSQTGQTGVEMGFDENVLSDYELSEATEATYDVGNLVTIYFNSPSNRIVTSVKNTTTNEELLASPTSDGSVSFNVPSGQNYQGTHDILIFAEAT